jgi:methanogenic corrinoid protein MtbC1
LIALTRAVAADLVGVSVTMPAYLPRVAALVEALGADHPPVLVGGPPFIEDMALARSLGAWQAAESAGAAVQLATVYLRERTTAGPAA